MDSKINILIATYNGEQFLQEQLESLFQQSYTNWKLLIHDDGSTDNTINIIKDYILKYPDKIQFFDDKLNFGSALVNFSFLLEKSNAKYIMFCDQDDIWLPNKIELTVKKMQELERENPNIPLLIHTDLKVVDSNLNVLSNSYWSYQGIDPQYDTLNRLLVQNIITGCTVMINRKLGDIALPIPNEVIMHDWWLGLVASVFGQIHSIDIPTILYRQHDNNDTGASSFNIGTILNKAKNLSEVDLKKYINQAMPLLERYDDKLSTEQKILLKDFIAIEKQSWLQSKQTLLKHKILKQNIIRNLGLLLCRKVKK